MATITSVDLPADLSQQPRPFPVRVQATPGSVVKVELGDTGALMGSVVADAAGLAVVFVDPLALAGLRSSTATPNTGASVGTARRSSKTDGRATATVRRSGGASLGAAGTSRRSGSSQPNALASARRSSATQGNASGTARRSETATPYTTGGASGASYVGAGTFSQGYYSPQTISVAYPAGIQSGDLLVLCAGGGWNGVPSGWTTINSDAAMFVAYKVHASGASVSVDAYDDGEGGSYALSCRVYAWRGVHATPVDVKSPASGFTLSANSTTHTGASLSPLSDSMLVLLDLNAAGNTAATGAGGGIDTHVAANSANGSINMGYDSTPSGGTTAPALTYGSSFASYLLTLALRKA